MQFPDGSTHDLLLGGDAPQDGYYSFDPTGMNYSCPTSATTPVQTTRATFLDFETVDGTFARARVYPPDADHWTLTFADGRKVDNVNGVQTVSDRNGNWYSVTTSCIQQGTDAPVSRTRSGIA